MILGENTSLDEVRSALNLFSSIPDTGISIEWDSDRHQVIDSQGTILQDDLTEDGTLVKLTAKLKYKEQSEKYEFAGDMKDQEHMCGMLEEHLNYVNHVELENTEPEDFQLDLLLPLREKQP